jgi:oligopeptidase B
MTKSNSNFLIACSLCLAIASCVEQKQEPTNVMVYQPSILLTKTDITAPVVEKSAEEMTMFGDTRVDNYYWMKLSDEQKMAETPDEKTAKVLDYLNAENAYREQMMSHTDSFQLRLFEEIKGRIKQTDMSVPYKENGYFYITRYEEGKEYPIISRKKDNLEAAEEIMLNVNELADGYSYFNVGGTSVSPDNSILAYGEDTVSRRQYHIRFKNLTDGSMLPDLIPNTTGSIVWGNDNKTVFYTLKDAALRSYKVMRHTLGTDTSKDVEIFLEEDETFGAYIGKTKSNQYLIIASYATLSQEFRILDANNPTGSFSIFQTREENLEYSIDHYGDNWYIRTNMDSADNFKIMKTPLSATTKENWTEVIEHRPDVLIEDFDLFKNHMVLSERVNGITNIRIFPWEGTPHYVNFGEETYAASTSTNKDFDTNLLRISYTSLTTPSTTYDYNVNTKELVTLKQQEVIGDFDAKDYQSERMFATATDGTQIPISIVYKRGFEKDGTRPLMLYGYGSYGISMEPSFSSVRLSLLDRGFAFAIAHVRGGQEMGRQWYEDGKFLEKKNTFTDFIACADYLLKEKYTNTDKLFASGGSAGGLLMGAVVNMRPELWRGIVAAVPFVDVVTTMLDETIPLTTGEFSEWGNPKEEEYYHYMKSYSPYDNVVAQDYPAMLITTGFHDSQVQYWEPAKWIAKLRELKTDNNPLLMYCNMETGHGGASGRFSRLREVAREYAFILDLAGLAEIREGEK